MSLKRLLITAGTMGAAAFLGLAAPTAALANSTHGDVAASTQGETVSPNDAAIMALEAQINALEMQIETLSEQLDASDEGTAMAAAADIQAQIALLEQQIAAIEAQIAALETVATPPTTEVSDVTGATESETETEGAKTPKVMPVAAQTGDQAETGDHGDKTEHGGDHGGSSGD